MAGVSLSTASKVINHEGNVKPELQDKVWKAVHELNYHPNAVARSLKSSTTNTLAVLFWAILPIRFAFWGGRIAYFSDPENNLWEVAWNPTAIFDERGAMISF
ncbi:MULTISPECIES: helix-turn-helix transcriptional regulator [unclassified Paenibacillus]|uniref:helix-turn-helix transcriptional regulator n=1 Tax=unclassified Paenibacillus TaxID=185978 RepID=UPI001B651262|nr:MULTISPECIES: helix-turn-helix transcriptional regulator [unclassified Paenibacillus]MBP1156451.1 DNA-binding LacI/PurR family transcriptional regulator [Paenibacillus sp. PvP091]MBP1168163.1 DNA-binding LacI/PurR family transcriptional regulator [Paenibacillus sp. PvR098]MBP2439191.1 DNA-binding LacI/PurR family transcriptional regulator [Paenibacillus sp. PvP052]